MLRGWGNGVPTDPNLFIDCVLDDPATLQPVARQQTSIVDNGANDYTVFKFNTGETFTIKKPVNVDLQFFISPVNANVVSANPGLAPYLDQPGYAVAVGIGTHYKTGDPSVLKWEVKAPRCSWLNNIVQLDARCEFLFFNGKPIMCYGCDYYLSTVKQT